MEEVIVDFNEWLNSLFYSKEDDKQHIQDIISKINYENGILENEELNFIYLSKLDDEGYPLWLNEANVRSLKIRIMSNFFDILPFLRNDDSFYKRLKIYQNGKLIPYKDTINIKSIASTIECTYTYTSSLSNSSNIIVLMEGFPIEWNGKKYWVTGWSDSL